MILPGVRDLPVGETAAGVDFEPATQAHAHAHAHAREPAPGPQYRLPRKGRRRRRQFPAKIEP